MHLKAFFDEVMGRYKKFGSPLFRTGVLCLFSELSLHVAAARPRIVPEDPGEKSPLLLGTF